MSDKGGILTATALGLTTRYLFVLAESKNRLLGANAVIAATAYRTEHEQYPDTWSQLVPNGLTTYS